MRTTTLNGSRRRVPQYLHLLTLSFRGAPATRNLYRNQQPNRQPRPFLPQVTHRKLADDQRPTTIDHHPAPQLHSHSVVSPEFSGSLTLGSRKLRAQRAKSLFQNILPISAYNSKIWRDFFRKLLILKDRGMGGGVSVNTWLVTHL